MVHNKIGRKSKVDFEVEVETDLQLFMYFNCRGDNIYMVGLIGGLALFLFLVFVGWMK